MGNDNNSQGNNRACPIKCAFIKKTMFYTEGLLIAIYGYLFDKYLTIFEKVHFEYPNLKITNSSISDKAIEEMVKSGTEYYESILNLLFSLFVFPQLIAVATVVLLSKWMKSNKSDIQCFEKFEVVTYGLVIAVIGYAIFAMFLV